VSSRIYYLQARPGITGLWQVSGRNDLDFRRRVHLDTWYVKNWSLLRDIVILVMTVRVVFARNGAY
jgi:lipopolysaccharide/colanic/teichoic acid biosynthesis glycosyltransferase